ncbi:MAG: hypothetical protein R3C18_15770 [Planctomycetaceae bacterium]
MSSETNSSPTVLRNELKVLGALVVMLLVVEGVLQLGESRLSIDIQHMKSFGQIAQQLQSQDEAASLAAERQNASTVQSASQILFLGNSMTRYGLDQESFERECSLTTGITPEVIALHPDNSRISEWYYLYRNFVAEQNRSPDILVVGFAMNQLCDAPSKTPDRIARYYGVGIDDLDTLSNEDLSNVEGWSDFVCSRYSATYATRQRVERRILSAIIPSYKESSNLINNQSAPKELQGDNVELTYRRLQDFLDMASEGGTQVVLVALPTQEGYDLDSGLVDVCRGKVTLIDARTIPGVSPDMIPDGLHLTPEGATRYSTFLADWLPVQQLMARHDRQLLHNGNAVRVASEGERVAQ